MISRLNAKQFIEQFIEQFLSFDYLFYWYHFQAPVIFEIVLKLIQTPFVL